MALTQAQKNIVNPSARTYSDPENDPTRNGVGYAYDQWRNKFVLNAIHESYISYYEFPAAGMRLFPNHIGERIEPENPLPREQQEQDQEEDQNRRFRLPFQPPNIDLGVQIITDDDLYAYCALYPQNGKVVSSDDGTLSITVLSEEEANEQLNKIYRISDARINYVTNSAPLSFDPDKTEGRYKLIHIDPHHSAEYIAQLRKAIGKEDTPPLATYSSISMASTILAPEITGYISTDANVDLDDWTNNCNPGTETSKTYYNARDQKFYYTKRTRHTSPDYYDLSFYEDEESTSFQTVKGNIESALSAGVKEILLSVGKFSAANQNVILNSRPKKAYFLSNLDIRPTSRWTFSVQIDRAAIDNLSGVDNMSYEEEELTVLQKAEVLMDPEKTVIAHHETYVFDDLLQYLRSTRILLEGYVTSMSEEGVYSLPFGSPEDRTPEPSDRSGMFYLDDEIARIGAIPDVLSTFLSYNKRTITEDTVLEFFFNSKYKLLYICADGELLTRGLGNTDFVKLGEDRQFGTILNAFGFMTSTTFSYLRHARTIHREYSSSGQDSTGMANGEQWTTFLPKYTYPQIDIDPETIKIVNEENSLLNKRKKLLFERISKIASVPPHQAELLYQRKVTDKNWVRSRVTELVKGANCDTVQAQLANDVVGFWNALNEKQNVRALIRETIILMKREIKNDAFILGMSNHDVLDGAERLNRSLDLDPSKQPGKGWAEQTAGLLTNEQNGNQAFIRKEIENLINSQITCALDVFGDVIQDGILNPIGVPPEINSLVRSGVNDLPLKVKLKKVPTISAKGDMSEVYGKVIETMIQQMLKSLLAGIARDLLRASLGCGPNPSQDQQLDNLLKRHDYGYSLLSEHTEGLNLRQIAVDSGLVTLPENMLPVNLREEINNLTRRREEALDDIEETLDRDQNVPQQSYDFVDRLTQQIAEKQSILEQGAQGLTEAIPPTPQQMKSFLRDISMMCTPAELQQLLFGEADNLLYELIYETVTNGEVKIKTGEKPDVNGDMKPTYYIVRPLIYKSLTKTKDIIRTFFQNVGNAMMPDDMSGVDDMSFQSPLEAYCSGKEPDLSPLKLRVSMEQLQTQYVQVIDSRINKINTLCEFLQSLNQIEEYINEMLNWIPIMDWYDAILQLLADSSNSFVDFITSLFAKWFDEAPPRALAKVDNFYSTRMGAELFFQIRDNLKSFNTFEVITLNSTTSPPVERDAFYQPDFGQTFYVLGGPQGTNDNANLQHLGVPYLSIDTPTNVVIEYLNPNMSYVFEASPMLPGASLRRLPLPYIEPHNYQQFYDEAEYASRTAPWAYRQALWPGFNSGHYPRTDSQQLEYGSDILEKISNTAWKSQPYTGFVSPIFVSARNLLRGGYDFYGINVGVDTPEYKKLASWAPEIGTLGQLWLDGDVESNLDSGQPLTEDNSPLVYGHAYAGWTNDDTYTPIFIGSGNMPSINNRQVKELLNKYFLGLFGREDPRAPWAAFANWKTSPDKALDQTYYTDIGKRRLPQYIGAINRDPLKVLDDRCVTHDDIKKATAIVKTVQTRVQKLFLNAMPIVRVYTGWNTISTKKIVCDYLSRSITQELTDRALMGLVYQNLHIVEKVFADEPDNNFSFSRDSLPKDNFYELVEAIYVGMLNNISKYSEYEWANTNTYSYYSTEYVTKHGKDNETLTRYGIALDMFFREMKENLENDQATYGIDPEEIPTTVRLIDRVINSPDGIKSVGHYYFPLGVLTAAQIIYYDYSINSAGRYSQTNYRLQLEAAGADDALLTAYRGVTTRQFSEPFRNFPQTVKEYTGESEITYYNSIEVRRRLELLKSKATIASFGEQFGAINYSVDQLVNMSFLEFQERIVPYVELWMRENNVIIDGLSHENLPGLTDLNDEDAKELAERAWYNVIAGERNSGRTPWGNPSMTYYNDVYKHILGDFDRSQRDDPDLLILAESSGYLNINKEISPGLFTPKQYFEEFGRFYSALYQSKRSSRAGLSGGGLPNWTGERNDPNNITPFVMRNETQILQAMSALYTDISLRAAGIENIRTERNSLEKLIIE